MHFQLETLNFTKNVHWAELKTFCGQSMKKVIMKIPFLLISKVITSARNIMHFISVFLYTELHLNVLYGLICKWNSRIKFHRSNSNYLYPYSKVISIQEHNSRLEIHFGRLNYINIPLNMFQIVITLYYYATVHSNRAVQQFVFCGIPFLRLKVVGKNF